MAVRFIKYKSFNDKALALDLCKLLSENDIPFAWESTEGFFDVSFACNDILNLYYVKIRQEDFPRADVLLAHSVLKNNLQPVSDYYLFSFSSDELIEVLKSPDEWNAFDQYWAKKILRSRGIEISEDEMNKAQTEKLMELKRPWLIDRLWLFFAFTLWVVALWFLNYFVVLAVLFLSVHISYSKKTMPDGQRVPAFAYTDRLLGKIVLAAGCLLLVFILANQFALLSF